MEWWVLLSCGILTCICFTVYCKSCFHIIWSIKLVAISVEDLNDWHSKNSFFTLIFFLHRILKTNKVCYEG